MSLTSWFFTINGILLIGVDTSGGTGQRKRIARQTDEWADWVAWYEWLTWNDVHWAVTTPPILTQWEWYTTRLASQNWNDRSNGTKVWYTTPRDVTIQHTYSESSSIGWGIALAIGLPLFVIILVIVITVGCVMCKKNSARNRSTAGHPMTTQLTTQPPNSHQSGPQQQAYVVPAQTPHIIAPQPYPTQQVPYQQPFSQPGMAGPYSAQIPTPVNPQALPISDVAPAVRPLAPSAPRPPSELIPPPFNPEFQ